MRLAVLGTQLLPHALRLRGATVQTYRAEDEIALAGCDALAVLETRSDAEQLIERCLAAGTHVLLAAPSFLPGMALDQLCAQARESNAQLAVLNPDRFIPSRQLIRQQVEAGSLGEPGLVTIHRWRGALRNLDAGLQMLTVAELDVAIWLIGSAPNLVYAVQTTLADGAGPGGRSLQVHLGFPHGPMALIDCVAVTQPRLAYRSLTLIGSAGAAYADDHQNMQLAFRDGQPQASLVAEGDRELLALIQEFVSGLAGGHDFSTSAAAWQRTMVIGEAVRRSLSSHQAVPLGGN